MNAGMDVFDFLRKGEVDLGEVGDYLVGQGYRVYWLRQPYRYVVGKVEKNGIL